MLSSQNYEKYQACYILKFEKKFGVLAIYDVLGKICDMLLHSERRREKNINAEYSTLLLKGKPFRSTLPNTF